MAVTQGDNGTWEVSVWYRDWQGERHRKHKRGFETKREAKAWETAFVAKQEGSPSMTMSAFYKVYEQDRRPHLKLNTWKSKEQMILTKILPYFGEMRMDQITPADILKWQAELLNYRDKKGRPYQPSYLRTINNQLTSMVNHAVRDYNLPVSPVAKAGKTGKKKGRGMQFWTKEEYERFSDAIMDKPLYFLAFEVLYWKNDPGNKNFREGFFFFLSSLSNVTSM